ncbi:DUF6660 family protein [Chitinophaga lutea]|nr:DUF6660 family protein [Chitinophaga lutea]
MKAWLFLFSIWILVCAGMPCTDHLDSMHSHGPTNETVHAAPHEPADQSADTCSPFCSCYCCAVTTVLPKPVNYFSKPVLLAAPVSRYLCPPAEELTDSFWQPPRHA